MAENDFAGILLIIALIVLWIIMRGANTQKIAPEDKAKDNWAPNRNFGG